MYIEMAIDKKNNRTAMYYYDRSKEGGYQRIIPSFSLSSSAFIYKHFSFFSFL
jgi:hypothetical protein